MLAEGKTLFLNGDFLTLVEEAPTASAIAVSDGVIVAVGEQEQCLAALGKEPKVVDLQGSTVLPGFIDTHIHPVMKIYFEMNANLTGVTTQSGLHNKIDEIASEAVAGQWVLGLNFDENLFEGKQPVRRKLLDSISPDLPTVVIKHDGHTLIANSKAIELANIPESIEPPSGGVIGRDADGRLNGVFGETAFGLVSGAIPLPTAEALRSGAQKTFAALAAEGITSIGGIIQTGEEGPAGAQGQFDLALMSMIGDEIPQSIYGILIADDIGQVEMARKTPLHNPDPLAGRTIGGLKIYADGSFGSFTAYMRKPYSDNSTERGMLIHQPADLYQKIKQVHNAGLQLCIHAIGDEAIDLSVATLARVMGENQKPDPRHRIEHASVLWPPTLMEIKRLGLSISTQPMFIHSEKSWLHKRLGPERAKRTYPFRSIIDAGVLIAGASDGPVESTDVIGAISCCLTREGFETDQTIGALDAIKMYTVNAAYVQFEEKVKGRLAPGMRADFICLSNHPLDTSPERFSETKILRTVCGGQTIYAS